MEGGVNKGDDRVQSGKRFCVALMRFEIESMSEFHIDHFGMEVFSRV